MKKLMCLLLSLQFLVMAAPAMAAEDDFMKNTQNDLIIIAGAGGAGAILGLSTLSFVDKPSEHLSNIWTGAALGVIAGVIFVAYNSAQRGSEDLQSSTEFNSFERVAWHHQNNQNLTIPSVQFGTQFWQTSF